MSIHVNRRVPVLDHSREVSTSACFKIIHVNKSGKGGNRAHKVKAQIIQQIETLFNIHIDSDV
jgi:hypothetical protein